jgi:hypothetical protein
VQSTNPVNGGDVLVTGGGLQCLVAHTQRSAGNLSTHGAAYEVVNLDNTANFKPVYWDPINLGVTSTSTGNAFFGYIAAQGGLGVGTLCIALHHPLAAAVALPTPTEGDILDQPSGTLVFVFSSNITAASVPLSSVTVLGAHPTSITQYSPNILEAVAAAWAGLPVATPWSIASVPGVCQAGSGTLGV